MHTLNYRSKRCERQLGYLEILLTPRNTDDRDTEQASDDHITQRKLPSGKQEPKYIYKERYGTALISDFLSKRIKGNG